MPTRKTRKTATFDRLRDIIVRDFELPPERLTRATALEHVELDSLALTELIFALEDELGVTAEGMPNDCRTLGDVADYVDRLIAARSATVGGPSSEADGAESDADQPYRKDAARTNRRPARGGERPP